MDSSISWHILSIPPLLWGCNTFLTFLSIFFLLQYLAIAKEIMESVPHSCQTMARLEQLLLNVAVDLFILMRHLLLLWAKLISTSFLKLQETWKCMFSFSHLFNSCIANLLWKQCFTRYLKSSSTVAFVNFTIFTFTIVYPRPNQMYNCFLY